MINGQYKSLGSILYKVLRNPLCAELNYNDAAEYALEFIKLIGAPVAYLDKIIKLDLQCYKAELPCDLLYINGVRYFIDCNSTDPIAMRGSSNIYHINEEEFKNIGTLNSNNEFTYKIQNKIIFTSMEHGQIEISYKGINLDEEGYPLLPDNEPTLLGCEYYIMSRYLEPLWLVGKITDKAFEFINQKRYFYTPSAITSLNMPTIDQMETLMNGLNRLIINDSAHQNFFKKFGEKEVFRKYN